MSLRTALSRATKALCAVILAVIGTLFTAHDAGPFASLGSISQQIQNLQVYLIGTIIPVLGIAVAVTERKQTEEALRRSEARFTAIMENAPAEIYLKDVEGRYVLINRECERLWGVTREEVRGKLPEQVEHPGDLAQRLRAHDLAVLSSGEVIEQEHQIPIDDNLHTISFIKFPIRGAAGEIAGLGAIATDVTQSKKLQQIKDEFISSVSHELRTPMTSILGALGLVQGGAAGRLPEKAQSMIDIAHKNCNRLVRLLNDILDIEKIESGNADLEMGPLELGPLARDAIETVAAYADEHDVEVRLAEDAHPVRVKADGDRLIQVLTNLLSNAIKFSPQGGAVELRISRTHLFGQPRIAHTNDLSSWRPRLGSRGRSGSPARESPVHDRHCPQELQSVGSSSQ